MKSILASTATALTLFATCGVVHAITIDFESAEGYEVGKPLNTQPSGSRPIWTAPPGFGEIVGGDGVEGGQAVRFAEPGSYATAWMLPEQLVEIPEQVRFSFAIMVDRTTPNSFDVPVRVRVGLDGDATALRLQIYAGGKIEFYDGGEAVRVKTEDGEDFFVREGVYTIFTGEIDLANSTFTITVDDVPQGDENGAAFKFNVAGERKGFGRFEITNSQAGEGNFFVDQIQLGSEE